MSHTHFCDISLEEKITEMKDINPEKAVLVSMPGEHSFCSSKTKHDRRTAQNTELFVRKRRLHK